MPIIDHNTINSPQKQADGKWRGEEEYIADDGRAPIVRTINVEDQGDDDASRTLWHNTATDLVPVVQLEMEQQDAEEGVSSSEEITAHRQASVQQRAVAYLRRAWGEEVAEDGFLMFDKFNDYRLSKGLTLNQVHGHLMDAGLTQEEWDEMKAAYQYLAGGGRPVVMAQARVIQANWDAR